MGPLFQTLALLVTLHSNARNDGTEMGRAAYVASASAGESPAVVLKGRIDWIRWQQGRIGTAAYHAAHDVGRSDSAGYYDSFHANDCPAGGAAYRDAR
jgi:hypothetical protein